MCVKPKLQAQRELELGIQVQFVGLVQFVHILLGELIRLLSLFFGSTRSQLIYFIVIVILFR